MKGWILIRWHWLRLITHPNIKISFRDGLIILCQILNPFGHIEYQIDDELKQKIQEAE